MKHIGIRHIVLILTYIGESGGRPVVAVGDDHLLLNYQSSHFPAPAIGILTPYTGHPQVAGIKQSTFISGLHILDFQSFESVT